MNYFLGNFFMYFEIWEGLRGSFCYFWGRFICIECEYLKLGEFVRLVIGLNILLFVFLLLNFEIVLIFGVFFFIFKVGSFNLKLFMRFLILLLNLLIVLVGVLKVGVFVFFGFCFVALVFFLFVNLFLEKILFVKFLREF